MNFKAFYSLSCNPFDKQSLTVKDAFQSEDQKAMMNRLSYLKDVRGIGVFTASPGMGKSHCLRCFEASLNDNLYDMHYICLSTVSVGEFYKLLCEELGLETKGGKTIMFKAIQERIKYLYKEKKQPFILAIDEAQYLGNPILKDLKMLMNFSFDSVNCFTLILSGEPYLNNTLEKPVHEALRQWITVHYSLINLLHQDIRHHTP
jgi:type II secretory pathway predicted ATPase ExeA